MTYLEAKTAVCGKLNIDWTDIANNDLFTAADIAGYVQTGAQKAWDFKPWTFAEKTYKTTTLGVDGYNDYPADFEDDSITRLTVAGKEWGKRTFEDYMKFFSENPLATDKIWCNQGRFYFVNENSYTLGDEIDVTGKLRCPILSADADKLPFSPTTDNQENSGNSAIVQLAYAEALGSEKKKDRNGAAAERKDAYGTLAILWVPMAARKSRSQSQDRPGFDVPDFFAGNSNGRNTNIGNFP